MLVEINLSHHGTVVAEMTTRHSSIYTLIRENTVPEMLVAKIPVIEPTSSKEEIEYRMRRFLMEAAHIRASCNHGSIHRFGHVEVIHGVPVLISTKRDLTLRNAIEESAMTVKDALCISIQICHALKYCQSKGIVAHQDLRPENIFLDSISTKFKLDGPPPYTYQAYLADFDMANASVLFGTNSSSRPYMAAEQYAPRKEFGSANKEFERIDIFALGVNLYEMLTGGLHPIGERTSDLWPHSTLGKKWTRDHLWKEWSRGEKRPPFHENVLDSGVAEIISACLEPSPTSRPSHADLEITLFAKLIDIDQVAAESLRANIDLLDEAARDNDASEWPYMDEMLRKIGLVDNENSH